MKEKHCFSGDLDHWTLPIFEASPHDLLHHHQQQQQQQQADGPCGTCCSTCRCMVFDWLSALIKRIEPYCAVSRVGIPREKRTGHLVLYPLVKSEE